MLSIGVVLFDGFELLDVFGPLEMLGMFPEHFSIQLVSENGNAVTSRQGPKSLCDYSFSDDNKYQILFMPGGIGTRREVDNPAIINWLREKSLEAAYVLTVCTGSALLAKTGILKGIRATTNKQAYDWVISQNSEVLWQPTARWVEDGKFFTSSGVSAGIDMTLGFIERTLGRSASEKAALDAEYLWNDNPDDDPFAKV